MGFRRSERGEFITFGKAMGNLGISRSRAVATLRDIGYADLAGGSENLAVRNQKRLRFTFGCCDSWQARR